MKDDASCKEEFQGVSILPQQGIYDSPLQDHLKRTKQDELPQATILRECIDSITHEGLQEAYLRGSFSSGEADTLSDIDLFLVIEPDNVAEIYDDVVSHLEEKYKIMVSCHDKLVADYGGIGFMFVCQSPEGHSFQLDLYFAMKGVAPKTPLINCPRIFSRDSDYCWVAEKEEQNKVSPKAQEFIDRMTTQNSVSDEMDYYMNDAMVALYIMKKHLQRGQNGRVLVDNNHLMGVGAHMIMSAYDRHSHHTALYAFDKLVEDIAEDNSLTPTMRMVANRLKSLAFEVPSEQKIVTIFDTLKVMHRHICPEGTVISNNVDNFESYAINPLRQQATKPRLKLIPKG